MPSCPPLAADSKGVHPPSSAIFTQLPHPCSRNVCNKPTLPHATTVCRQVRPSSSFAVWRYFQSCSDKELTNDSSPVLIFAAICTTDIIT